jgi:hypothetical protein
MLDWFVRFAQSGGTINTANVGLTNLIDSLWDAAFSQNFHLSRLFRSQDSSHRAFAAVR